MSTLATPLPRIRGGLELYGVLGRGATSVVYRGMLGKTEVVAKVSDATLADPVEIERMFRREAAVLGSLRHPAIPAVYEVGKNDDFVYIITEFCAGRTLAERLARGPLDDDQTLDVARQLAEALAVVHDQGLVHRDLKPTNVLIAADGRVHLIDFGLATHASLGETGGTLRYSSPEQAGMLRRTVDGRSDLYALGGILFECVAGEPPFTSSDVAQLLHEHAAVVPPALHEQFPHVDRVLSEIVARLLRKDPDERYASAHVLSHDLRRVDVLRAAVGRGEPLRLGDPGSRPAPRGAFVGRAEQLEALSVALGDGEAVPFVVGPSGMGKSRLVEEVLYRTLPPQSPVLCGKCVSGDPYPFAPLRQALLGYLSQSEARGAAAFLQTRRTLQRAAGANDDILCALDPRLEAALGTRIRAVDVGDGVLVNVLATFLVQFAREHGGAVLWLDDVQWLDDASRQTLAATAHQLGEGGLRLLLSARDDPRHQAELASLAGVFGDDRILSVSVPPLSEPDVSALVTEILGAPPPAAFMRRVFAHSHGNPMVVSQYVQALRDAGALVPHWGRWALDEERAASLDLPTEIVELLGRRVASLEPRTRAILGAVALLGGPFDVDLLHQLMDGGSLQDVQRSIAQAQAARLVETIGEGGALDFVHDRVRESLAADAEPRATDVYRRAAATLDARAQLSGRNVFELAWFYVRGWGSERPAEVLRCCLEAAELAVREHAYQHAVALLDAAREAGCLALADHVALQRFYWALGLAQFHLQRIEASEATFRAALDCTTDPIRRADLRAWICRTLIFRFDTAAGLAEAETAFAELGAPLPTQSAAADLPAVLMGLMRQHLGEIATTEAGGSVAQADRDRDTALVRLCDVVFLIGYYERQPMVALMGGVLALLPSHRLGLSPEACSGFATFAMLLGLLGRTEQAEQFAARAMGLARKLGDRQAIALTQSVAAIALHFAGQVDYALSLQREVFSRFADRLGPIHFQNCCIDLSWNLYIRGLADEELRVSMAAIQRLSMASGAFLAAYACRAAGSAAAAAARLGRMAMAAELRAEIERYRDIVPPERTIPWMSVEGFLVGYYAAQRDFTPPFYEAVKRFEAWGIPPERSALHSRHYYVERAYAELERGAIEALTEAVGQLERTPPVPTVLAHLRVLQAAIAAYRGDLQGAEDRVDEARRLARRNHNPWALLEAAHMDYRIAIARGNREAAQHHLDDAVAIASRYDWRPRARALDRNVRRTTARDGRSNNDVSFGAHSQALQQSQLEGLLALARATTAVTDPDEHAAIALDEIVRQLGAERGIFFRVDGVQGKPRFWCGRTADRRDLDASEAYSTTAVGRAIETDAPVLIGSRDDAVKLTSESMLAYDLRSILALPLRAAHRLLGVIYLENRLAHGMFTQDQVELLHALGNHLAMAIQTADTMRLELQLQAESERRRVAEVLRAATTDLTATLYLPDILQKLLAVLCSEVRCAQAAVLLDTDGDTVIETTGGLGAAQAMARIARGSEAGDDRIEVLVARDEPIGCVLLSRPEGGEWQVDRLVLASALIGHASAVIDNARLFRRVRDLAERDALTGLLNRREFFRRGALVIEDARERGQQLSAAMFDADHFKSVNDTYGHTVGDDLLRLIARVAGEVIDATGILGRYGGEEFAMLLIGVDARGAVAIAERVRAAIEAASLPLPGSPDLRVTVSVGVAEVRPGQTISDVLTTADRALYASKAGGRNCVTLYEETP